MESLSDTQWDVVISGTGLQQSLLALALSRSGKKILHVDPNEYYGGTEAALSLQDAEAWAERYSGQGGARPFSAAHIATENEGLAASRSYSLPLAPQLIHARSELVNQLVSSKAFRQIEFLACGSFFIYQAAEESSESSLSRIPSTREDVFSNTIIPARAKRRLMKFLKFVFEYDSEQGAELWKPKASQPLAEFLENEFNLDSNLQSYVVTLTLSPDGKITVCDGLAAIHRHLTSMGVFGAGFAALYPKWGGLSEVAQVGCRAGAVGGAVYMLGTGICDVQCAESDGEACIEASLTNGLTVKSKRLVRNMDSLSSQGVCLTRLIAIVDSHLPSMFDIIVEGAPTPCTAVVAFPVGSVSANDGTTSGFPIYALVHSSDTGTIYLSTISSSNSKSLLDKALSSFLDAISTPEPVKCLWRMSYEQTTGTGSFSAKESIGAFDPITADLAFNDSTLTAVNEACQFVGGVEEEEYMKFDDREGVNDDYDNDAFDS
ncbi:Rab proteins geranylgeranyltransferase component A [Metarhizium rileyi]|uniref:Rab proteins geranylgeranyltransferase n=1 Tax=Metarhizium rileyi (strain RCEF 4871) TaxID=1649241 RepID=A0A5C6GGR8_METRR|nr:Rab proteins geranylgeranyltransferase component A [Metarhizium rileyi]